MSPMDEDLRFCAKCGIPLSKGNDHDRSAQCIAELRRSLVRQAKAAENLAFEVSTRLFGILENLAHNPLIAGVRYYTHDPKTGEESVETDRTVAGVMTAILREYQKAGNWAPLREAKNEAERYRSHARYLLESLELILDDNSGRDGITTDLLKAATAEIDAARQHGVHLPGPHYS